MICAASRRLCTKQTNRRTRILSGSCSFFIYCTPHQNSVFFCRFILVDIQMSTVSNFLLRRVLSCHSIRKIHLTGLNYQERYFTKKHEWIQIVANSQNTNEVRIGISDYAQRALGDVVYCELPAIGTKFKQEESFATLESVKAVSDCYMPIQGEVSAVNEKLQNEADLINKSPYENGWLIQAIINEQQKKDLSKTFMNEKIYEAFLETTKEASDH
jgi:glycine cleavage system H protein